MKLFKTLIIAIAMIAITPLNAQTADEIINNYFENTGGSENWEKLEGTKMEAEADAQGMTIPVELLSTKDGKQLVKINLQGQEMTQVSFELKENYSVLLTWVYSGMTHVSTVRFDCVLDPVGDLNVTLNDLIEEVVDMDERLTRQATIQGTGRTAEQAASIYAVKAWGDVYRWIKSKSDAQGGIVPRLIVDREALRRVVVARACARVFRAEGGGLDSESRQLFEDFSDEAVARFSELGPLAYDSAETGVADSTVSGWSVVQTQRTW